MLSDTVYPGERYCNVCESSVTEGLECDYCGVTVDEPCSQQADRDIRCKEIATEGSMRHHWVRLETFLGKMTYYTHGGIRKRSREGGGWSVRVKSLSEGGGALIYSKNHDSPPPYSLPLPHCSSYRRSAFSRVLLDESRATHSIYWRMSAESYEVGQLTGFGRGPVAQLIEHVLEHAVQLGVVLAPAQHDARTGVPGHAGDLRDAQTQQQ